MSGLFRMRLRKAPFEGVLYGAKTIEYRLNDKKRARMEEGDQIVFMEIGTDGQSTGRTVKVRIEQIVCAAGFADLKEKLMEEGLPEAENFEPGSMAKYYTRDKVEEFGVMGIRISLIRDDVRMLLNESCFSRMERQAMVLRLGLDGGEPETCEAVAERFNVSAGRIRQIEEKLAWRLLWQTKRHRLLERFLQ